MDDHQGTDEKTQMPHPGQCTYIKPDGSRCRANARTERDYCFIHDPDSAEERGAARSGGGKERSRRLTVLSADASDVRVCNAADITTLLTETMSQVRRGQIAVPVANSVGYLAGISLKALQRDDLEQRLARLESVLARQQARPGADCEIEFVNPE